MEYVRIAKMVLKMKNDVNLLIDEFLNYLLIERGLSQNTILAYNKDIIQYSDYLSETLTISDMIEVKRENIIEFLSYLYDLNLQSKTISRKISSIKMFHKFLFLNHYLKENVSIFIEQPKIKMTIPSVLSLQEINDLLASFSEKDTLSLRNKTMVELMYSTGLRVSELVNLNIEDIHLSMGFLKCKGKGSKERIVPIGEKALHILKKYLSTSRTKLNINYDNQILFLNREGMRISRQSFWKILKEHAKIINLPRNISPHKLRHSFATHLLENNVDIRFIQELLGHSDISTTQIYTHVNSKKLNDVVVKYHPRGQIEGDNK